MGHKVLLPTTNIVPAKEKLMPPNGVYDTVSHFKDRTLCGITIVGYKPTIVEKFRKKELSILVTTTILERGVTFSQVDVFVCMANHHLYTCSSLILIGGWGGPSPERPTGKLYFFHEGLSKSMLQCRKEINAMNKKGGFENEVSTM